jgi:hypothetical protein
VSPDRVHIVYPQRSPYAQQVLAQFPRLLSSGDREPPSLTYGCFDRSFWAWKFTDFAGARFQEAAYALAHCYRTPGFGEFSGHRKIFEWTRASMAFWCTLQRADGSFDEAYPFEHSLAATAFTGFYMGEAFQLLSDELSANERSVCRTTFARAGNWLVRNDEFHGVLSNHLAAAAAALVVIERITEDHRYGERAQYFVRRIYEHQSSEGWYEEYGGADPGYQSHGTFYLARIWQLTGDRLLLESLSRSVAFLKYFIHPNGTLGGEYSSRNTEFFFPAGFEILASALPDAAAIAAFMRPAIAQSSVANLTMMDRYNLLPMLNNYLFADAANRAAGAPEDTSQQLPCEQDGEWYFPDAGLLVRNTASYYAVIGLSKGGVVKIYNRRRRSLMASDCGYWVELANESKASNQGLTRPPLASISGNSVEIKANFIQVNQRVMSPWLFGAFRWFSLTVGRSQSAGYWIKNILAYILVRRRVPVRLILQRTIAFGPNHVSISDILSNPTSLRVSAILPGDKFSTIHMGSARYFQYEELSAPALDPIPDAASQLTTTGVFPRFKTWTIA